MTVANKAGALPGQLYPLSIVRMLWKQKLVIVSAAILFFLGAAFYISRLPNVYSADAIVLVDSEKIPEKYVASTVQMSLQDSLNAISHQVLSAVRMRAIIDELNLYQKERAKQTPEEILDLMRNRDLSITVEHGFSGGRSGAFRISYEGPNPAVVAEVVNRIAALFIQENARAREERAEGTSEFIEAQLKQAKKTLDEQETSLSQYKTHWNGELPQQEAALLGNLNRLQVELQGNEEAISRAQQSKLLLENTLQLAESALATASRRVADLQAGAPPSRLDLDLGMPALPERRSDALREQLERARSRYTDDYPDVKRLQAELDVALAEEAAAVAISAAKSADPTAGAAAPGPAISAAAQAVLTAELNRERERISTTKTQIDLIDREMVKRNAEEQRIKDGISNYEARVEKLPLREQQMAALTRDYETSKANYRSLLDKKTSAEMASEMEREQQSERFTVADPARIPNKPIRPKRLLLSGGAAIFALAFAIAVGLAIELKKGVILGEWELPPGTPVFGRIGFMAPPKARVSAIHIAMLVIVAGLIQYCILNGRVV